MAHSAAQTPGKSDRSEILNVVKTPLGFFVLVVLVVEACIGGLIASAPAASRPPLIGNMLWVVVGFVIVVAGMAVWRPEALQGKRSQQQIITRDDAVTRCDRFSQLLAAYLVVRVLSLARRGYGYEHVMSDIRKRLYGYKDVFGTSQVEGTNVSLSILVGRALSTAAFHQELGDWVASVLRMSLDVVLKQPEISASMTPSADVQAWPPELRDALSKLGAADAAYSSAGIDLMFGGATRIIWHHCERSILSPNEVMSEPRTLGLRSLNG